MKMFFFCLLILLFSSFAQSPYTQKLYHFVERKPVESNVVGDSIASHFIYIELPKDVVSIWQAAVIEGKSYTVHASLMNDVPLVIGTDLKSGKMISITPKSSCSLWNLELDIADEKNASLTVDNATTVVLKGVYKNRKISCTVSRAVEVRASDNN